MAKKKEGENVGLFVDVPIQMYRQLEKQAKKKFCSKRSVVLQALRDYLQKEAK